MAMDNGKFSKEVWDFRGLFVDGTGDGNLAETGPKGHPLGDAVQILGLYTQDPTCSDRSEGRGGAKKGCCQ